MEPENKSAQATATPSAEGAPAQQPAQPAKQSNPKEGGKKEGGKKGGKGKEQTPGAEGAPNAAGPAGAPEQDPRKARKEAAKKEREAAAAAKAAAKGQPAPGGATQAAAPKVTSGENFGVLPLMQSQAAGPSGKQYATLASLAPSQKGKTVLVRARVYSSRPQGNFCFFILRQQEHTLQAVVMKNLTSKDFVTFASSLSKETIVDIEGTVEVPDKPIDSAFISIPGIEIHVRRLFVVHAAFPSLPLLIEDAARSQALIDAQETVVGEFAKKIEDLQKELNDTNKEAKQKEIDELIKQKDAAHQYVVVGPDQRYDNRTLDLRTPANQAIFRIQAGVCQLFREFLLKRDFMEIHSPKMISTASEGGAAVFTVDYFQTKAYLAQSPQFYKQMAICADFNRVFEIGPVFRAENAVGYRHLTEFTGLDFEMAFVDHYHEVLDLIEQMFVFIFEEMETRFRKELAIIRQQFPSEPVVIRKPVVRLPFKEAVQILAEGGIIVDPLEDLNTENERKLGQLIKTKYQTDFYTIDKFPTSARPFYTMLDPHDKNYTNAYDLFLRGEEITSGSQRVHDFPTLEARAIEKGVSTKGMQAYVDAFKYGAPPHAGCGIGLERIVLFYLGLKNIRRASLFPRDPNRLAP